MEKKAKRRVIKKTVKDLLTSEEAQVIFSILLIIITAVSGVLIGLHLSKPVDFTDKEKVYYTETIPSLLKDGIQSNIYNKEEYQIILEETDKVFIDFKDSNKYDIEILYNESGKEVKLDDADIHNNEVDNCFLGFFCGLVVGIGLILLILLTGKVVENAKSNISYYYNRNKEKENSLK